SVSHARHRRNGSGSPWNEDAGLADVSLTAKKGELPFASPGAFPKARELLQSLLPSDKLCKIPSFSWLRIGSSPLAPLPPRKPAPERKIHQLRVTKDHRKRTHCRGVCVCLR